MVLLRHLRPAARGRGHRPPHPDARSRDLVDWKYVGDAFSDATMPAWADQARAASGRRTSATSTASTACTTSSPRRTRHRRAQRQRHRHGDRADPGRPVDGQRRARRRPAPRRRRRRRQLPLDLRPVGGHRHRRQPVALLRLLLRRHLRHAAERRRPHAVGAARPMVAIDNKFEGAYVVRRDGWWYLFASTANCCAGPTTGYSVQVGRSRDLAGPYVDREGVPLTASRAGGTPTLDAERQPLGRRRSQRRRHRPGRTGLDRLPRHRPRRPLPGRHGGINERPMLIDRLDWVDGWPVVRAAQRAERRRAAGSGRPTASPTPSRGRLGRRHHGRTGRTGLRRPRRRDAPGQVTVRDVGARRGRPEVRRRALRARVSAGADGGRDARLALDPATRTARLAAAP